MIASAVRLGSLRLDLTALDSGVVERGLHHRSASSLLTALSGPYIPGKRPVPGKRPPPAFGLYS